MEINENYIIFPQLSATSLDIDYWIYNQIQFDLISWLQLLIMVYLFPLRLLQPQLRINIDDPTYSGTNCIPWVICVKMRIGFRKHNRRSSHEILFGTIPFIAFQKWQLIPQKRKITSVFMYCFLVWFSTGSSVQGRFRQIFKTLMKPVFTRNVLRSQILKIRVT